MDALIEVIQPLRTLMTFAMEVVEIHYGRVGEA